MKRKIDLTHLLKSRLAARIAGNPRDLTAYDRIHNEIIDILSHQGNTSITLIGYKDCTVQITRTSPSAKTTSRTSRDSGLRTGELRDFFEVGWIIRRALFRIDEIARMRACFDELEQIASGLTKSGLHGGSQFVLGEKDGGQVIKRVVWAGGCQRYLLEIGNDPRLTAPCAQLLSSNAMDHLLSQAHFKRPRDGVIFDWHQDIRHRDKGNGTWIDINGRGSFVQTVLVLDEMTPDSGPLLFIPGSSTWGRVDFEDHDCDLPQSSTKTPAELNIEDAVAIAAQPGDALFFGPYTVHASFENTSNHYRRVLINGYASPGANHRDYPGDGAGRRLAAPSRLFTPRRPPL